MRRLAFTLTIVFLHNSVVLQILVIDFAILYMMIFYFVQRPMVEPIHNFVQVFNEAAVMLLVMALVLLTDFENDPVIRYSYGYKFINAVYAIFAFNLLIFALIIILKIHKVIKTMYLKYKAKKSERKKDK